MKNARNKLNISEKIFLITLGSKMWIRILKIEQTKTSNTFLLI